MSMQNRNLPTKKITVDDLKPGDVFLCPPAPWGKEGAWIGQAIVALTKGYVSHAAIYYGDKDGERYVADADVPGITFKKLDVFREDEPEFYVRRHEKPDDLTPVLHAVDKYVNESNPYPFVNLGLLGLLIVCNRYTHIDKHIYRFMVMLANILMKWARDWKHPGKHPMTCSQFAAQCYTDAGEQYDMAFSELIIRYGSFEMAKNDAESPLSLLLKNIHLVNEVNLAYKNAGTENETEITREFISSLETVQRNTKEEMVPVEQIASVTMSIVSSLYFLKEGKAIEDPVAGIHKLLSSTNRNFFVAPDDILLNCTNLIDVGILNKDNKE